MEPAKLFTIEQIIHPKGPAIRSEVSEVLVSRAFPLEQIVLPKGPQPAVVAVAATLEVNTAPAAIVTSDTAVIDVVASDAATTAVAMETVVDKPAN